MLESIKINENYTELAKCLIDVNKKLTSDQKEVVKSLLDINHENYKNSVNNRVKNMLLELYTFLLLVNN